MNARLNAFIVPDVLLTQPPLSSPTSYPTCCSRSYQFHRTRPAAHAASLINIQTQPAAAAMDNYRNALLNTPSADTHVSGLTRCSGNPADTDFYFHRTQPAAAAMDNYRNASRLAAHAATFQHPIGVGSLTDPDIFEDP
jgi:hypothetical protein